MNVVTIVIIVLQVIVAIALIVLILLHAGRGGGLSDMFGGGMGPLSERLHCGGTEPRPDHRCRGCGVRDHHDAPRLAPRLSFSSHGFVPHQRPLLVDDRPDGGFPALATTDPRQTSPVGAPPSP